MRNTVSEALTPGSSVEEIRLLLSNSQECNKICVVVEGDDDLKAYLNLFDKGKVVLHPVGSCSIIPDAMNIICHDKYLKNRVIGIKDADFDHLMGKEYDIANLFLTDTHDVETLMLTEKVEQKVCVEMVGKHCAGIKESVMRILQPYSYIQYYNVKEILQKRGTGGLLFAGFKPNILKENAYSEWYSAVKSHGNNTANTNFPSEQQLRDFIKENRTNDLLNLTRGHDVVHLMGILLQNNYPKVQLKPCGRIAEYIRVAYTLEEFRQTNLFKAIDAWAKKRRISLWQA